MKAKEFIGKFGVLLSKCFIENWSDLAIHYGFDIKDLERLVESHELVESHGGLEMARKELHKRSIVRWVNPEVEALRKAIADVESCKRLEVG